MAAIRRSHEEKDDGRLWYYWYCEACEQKTWYLSRIGMVKGSVAHQTAHKEGRVK